MKRSAFCLATFIVAVALTGCGGFAGLSSLPLPGGPDLGANPKTVIVEEADAVDLARQASVKVNDVTVGEVTAIQRDGWNARITVQIRKDVDLPANAVASIQQTGLLGEQYVDLAPPKDQPAVGTLRDGAVIGLGRTTTAYQVEQVLGALSLLLNGGGIDRVQTITTELNQALAGREGQVRDVLGRLNEFVRDLAANRTSIVSAIDGLDSVSRVAAAGDRTIAAALRKIPGALAVLADEREQLVTMLDATARFSDVATHTVQASKAALLSNLHQLGPILDQLANSADALPGGLQYLTTFPFSTNALTALKGDYFNFDLEVSVTQIGLLRLLGLQAPANPVRSGSQTGGLGGLLGGLLGSSSTTKGSPTPAGNPGVLEGLLGGLL